jgi:signal transduction histidine kinase/CheY-like chemotaxis protein
MKRKKYHILKQPEYFVLLLAFLVVTAIFTISIITNQSIFFLQRSNRNTSNSFLLKDRVQVLLSDVLMMETLQRGIVMGNENSDSLSKALYVENVENDLVNLRTLIDVQFTKEYDQLFFFVKRKIKFTRLVINAYEQKGREEAQGIINTQIGDNLRDSVYTYAKQLETVFGGNVQTNLDANYQKSKRLQPITTSLSIISLVAIIGLSWLILYRINQKNQLIRSLRKAHRREIKARKELVEAKKAAESSATIKQNFLANMSHEIRTPINAVLGFSTILGKMPLTIEQQKFVRLIQNSGSSLLAIVNDILDISKIEAGMLRIEKINFSLRATCDSVITMFSNQVKDKKLTLDLHIADNCPDALVGDPLRLTQILTNLIGNAVKFTANGGISISVSIVEQGTQHSHLRFEVKDTGIGMSEDQIEKVFDRFDQGENDITRRFGGTGLGLAIVKNLVELQQGKISLESRKEIGSKFIFVIPFGIQNELQQAVHTTAVAETTFSAAAKILVVEDNEVNQMLVEYIFTEWGLAFELANNGLEAIEKLKTTAFDLVLMDIQMPGMDGYSTTAHIRKEMGLTLPIIAMTAHALPGEQERCLSSGMNGYVSKPLKEEVLKSELARYLELDEVANEQDNGQFIDSSFVHAKFSGNAEFIRKIIMKVQEQFAQEIQELDTAIQSRDRETVGALAHKMKTTVTIVNKNARQVDWLHEIEMGVTVTQVQWTPIEEMMELLRQAEGQLRVEAHVIMEQLKVAI